MYRDARVAFGAARGVLLAAAAPLVGRFLCLSCIAISCVGAAAHPGPALVAIANERMQPMRSGGFIQLPAGKTRTLRVCKTGGIADRCLGDPYEHVDTTYGCELLTDTCECFFWGIDAFEASDPGVQFGWSTREPMCLFVTVPLHNTARIVKFSVNFSLVSRPDVLSAGTLSLIASKYSAFRRMHPHSAASPLMYLEESRKNLCGNSTNGPQHNLVRRCMSHFNATVQQLHMPNSRHTEDVTHGVIAGVVILAACLLVWLRLIREPSIHNKQA